MITDDWQPAEVTWSRPEVAHLQATAVAVVARDIERSQTGSIDHWTRGCGLGDPVTITRRVVASVVGYGYHTLHPLTLRYVSHVTLLTSRPSRASPMSRSGR